jgi:hypothetical protein
MPETKAANTTAALPQAITPAEQRELLDRIVASPQFRRAIRLREFLLFVGHHTLNNGSAPIHEQEIGAALFERPAIYDTSIDNIVRVNATELRKRLEQYFTADGADEPVVVEMPRGSYTLLFRPRAVLAEAASTLPDSTASALVEPAAALEIADEVVPPVPRANRFWPAVSVVLLLFSAVMVWQNLHLRKQVSPWRDGAALRSFWAEFFDTGQEVDIVLADTSFALAEDIEGRSIPLASYLNYDYKRIDNIAELSSDRRADLGSVLDRNNGSVGDYIVAQRILQLDHSTPSLQLKFAREYSSEAIKTNSVILVGSRQSNPWVQLFDTRMNFSMDYDPVQHRSTIRNRQPKAGEQAEYVRAGDVSHDQPAIDCVSNCDLSQFLSLLKFSQFLKLLLDWIPTVSNVSCLGLCFLPGTRLCRDRFVLTVPQKVDVLHAVAALPVGIIHFGTDRGVAGVDRDCLGFGLERADVKGVHN